MSTVETHAASPTFAATLPPGPRIPKVLQGLAFGFLRRPFVHLVARRYGDVFSLHVPIYGPIMVVANPQLAKQIFTTSPDVLGNIQPNLSRLLGPGLGFRAGPRRAPAAPPAPCAAVPRQEHQELRDDHRRGDAARDRQLAGGHAVRDPAVDDAHHAQRDPARGFRRRRRRARRAPPNHPAVGHAGFAAGLVAQTVTYLWPLLPVGSAGGWRARYDAIIDKLIDDERCDPYFEDRNDVLALMLRSTYEDGSAMSREDIGDELLTLLAAGHETTASALAWTSSGSAATPKFWPVSRPRPTPTTTSCARRRSSSHSAVEPSSTPSAATSTRRRTSSANGRSHAGTPSSSAFRGYTATPNCSPSPSGSTRSASSAPSRPASPGSRMAAAPGAAWAPCSPTWRWTWFCERCCATSLSKPPTAPGEKLHSRGVAYTPKDGGKIVVRRR